jgi:hypothetical protein
MLPYLVTSNEDSVALLELDDGRFQMLEPGPLARFASGYQYLLVDRALAKYMKSLKIPQITLAPAVVLNRATGQEYRSHTRVFVSRSFHTNEIKALALEANPFSYLEFSEGLSAFAGAA